MCEMYVRPASRCTHFVTSTLATMLPSKHNACPTCIVTSHIIEVDDVQQRYNELGGASRTKLYEVECSKMFTSEWYWAKLAAANRIADIEDLLEDKDVSAQDRLKLTEALKLWDKAKARLSRLAGTQYVDGAEEHRRPEEAKEGARLSMAGMSASELSHFPGRNGQQPSFELFSPSPFPSSKSSQNRTWRWRPLPNHPMHLFLAIPPIPTEYSAPQQSAHQLQGGKPVANRSVERHPSLQQADATPPTTSSSETPTIRRSNDDTPIGSKPASPSHKRVHFSDFATVSSEHLSVSDPSPFRPLSRTTLTIPHFSHTDAEKKRHRSKWFRNGSFYEPGAWASPKLYTKAETSFISIPPCDMDAYVKEELRQEAEEKWVAAQLKLIPQLWLEIRRAEDVAPSSDLEGLVVEGCDDVHP